MSEDGADLAWDAGSLPDLAREFLAGSDESAEAYLGHHWLVAAMGALREARLRAGLTQEVVAQRMGTTQSAIARLERDHRGGISLARFVAYALACGMLPLDVELRPVDEVRAYALADPEAPRTVEAVDAARRAGDGLTVSPPSGVDAMRPSSQEERTGSRGRRAVRRAKVPA